MTFNSGFRAKRANDTQGMIGPQAQFLQKSFPRPFITNYSVSGVDDLALNPAGGQTVIINGGNFATGVSAVLDGTQIGAVTLISSSQISFTSPAKASGSYTLIVYNPSSDAAAILVPGLIYSGVPTWTTPAGSIGSVYETKAINTSVVATSDSALTYAITSGSIPVGATFYANGVMTGTAPVDSSSTTYTFAVTATDAELQDTTRTFTLTVNTDVVSWVNPTNSATISLDENAYSTSLNATDAAGYSVSYTANTLPTGLTLTSGVISGTPSVEGTTTTLLTATAATTNRSATNTVTWIVSFADANFKYVTALLSTTTPTVLPFNTDTSINNAVVTINGDTKPFNFNPYTPGYYGVLFNGTTDYLTVGSTNQNLSGDFTIEAWVYQTAQNTFEMICGDGPNYWAIGATNNFELGIGTGTVTYPTFTSGSAFPLNQWVHVAICRSGTSLRGFINGTQIGSTATNSSVYFNFSSLKIGQQGQANYYYYHGTISNFRIVKGQALYTANFTPNTTPLTTTSQGATAGNVNVLTCQSNRYIDNSNSAFTITASGTPQIKSFTPYTPSSSYSTYGSTYFDGTGDYLSNATNNIILGTSDFTIEFWMYCATTASVVVIYDNRINTTNNTGGLNIYHQSGTVYLYGGATTNVLLVSGTVTYNTWNHISFVRSGSGTGNVKLYINGALVSTYGSADTNNYVQGYLNIGCYLFGGTASNFYTGYLTDFRIVKSAVYTGAFTPPTAPLTAIANTSLLTCQGNLPVANNTFLDNSTNNFAITRSGNTTQGNFSPYGAGWSNYFDGTGDYLSFNAVTSPTTGDFTVEFWFYNTRSAWNTTFDITDGGNGAMAIYFGSGGDLRIAPQAQSSTLIASVSSLSLNTWIHFAIIRSSGSLRAYANGTALAAAISYTTSLTGFTKLGGTTDGYVLGYISNFRYTTNAVYSIAGSTITVPTSPLQPITGTQFLTCQSPNIVDNSANNFTITRNGDTSVQKFSPFAGTTLPTPYYGAYFDGNGDYLSTSGTPINFGTGNFTIEWWVYRVTSYSSDRDEMAMGGVGGTSFMLGMNNGNLQFGISGTSWNITSNTNIALATWAHCAIVRSGTTVTMYINGVSTGTATMSTNFTGATAFDIGRRQGTVINPIQVYCSNLRIVNGTAVYTSAFTPPTSPLTAITNTSLLTCQSNTFVDNSTNNYTITSTGDTKPTTYNPFTVTYLTKQSYTPSVYGGSMYFDGTGDYLTDSTARAQYAFYGRDGTVECWIYPTSFAADRIIWSLKNTGAGINDNMLKLAATSGVLQWSDGSTWNSSGVTPSLNAWSHVAWVKSSTTVKLYLNGVQVLSVAYSPGSNIRILVVGADDTFVAFMQGYIADFRIVNGTALYTSNFVPGNAPLTAIKNTTSLINGTSAAIYDSSEMSNYETVGDAKINNFGPYNAGYYSNYFDGSGDYLSVPSNAALAFALGDFTVELWAYHLDSSAYSGYYWGNSSGFVLRRTNANKLEVSQDGVASILISTATIPVGQWVHIAATRSGTTFRLFINGTLDSSVTSSANFVSTGAATIGSISTTAGYYMNGYISNLRLLKGQALYTATFTPPTAPLTAIANTSLLTCQSNKFVDNSTNAFTITRNGDTRVATQNPFQANTGESMYFDGTGDYLTTPSISFQNFAFNTGDFTMEAWIYPTVFSGDKVIISSFATWATSVNFFFGTRAGTPNVLIFRAGDSLPISLIGNTALNTNEWAHVAVSRSSGTTRIFVNGVVQTATHTGTVNISATVRPVMIGSDDAGAPAELFVGNISDLRVTKGVARYTTTFTPPIQPLKTK